MIRLTSALLCTLLLFTVSAAAVHAQDQDAGALPANPPPVSLRTLLERLRYDDAERGPLIVIAPEKARRPTQASSDDATNGDADAGSGTNGADQIAENEDEPTAGLSLGGIARRFRLNVTMIGGVIALVPRTMTVINTKPGTPDPYAGLRPELILRLLLSTLSPAQWQVLCGPGGIGFGDLSPNQQPLFDDVIPTHLKLIKQHVVASSKPDGYEFAGEQDISVDDRARVRLRLGLGTDFSFKSGPPAEHRNQPGETVLRTTWSGSYGAPGKSGATIRFSAFGVQLVRSVPNRPKPGQIDFSAPTWNARVSLIGLGKRRPLGDLIGRIRAATGQEVLPDRRLSTLGVYVRGRDARAGDLLQAISLSVTGTYRRVGMGVPATYVLTDDLEGIGARQALLERWARHAFEQQYAIGRQALDSVVKQNPMQYLTFAPDDPLALTDDLKNQILGNDPGSYEVTGPEMKTSDLPTALQNEVRHQYFPMEGGAQPFMPDTSRVMIGMHMTIDYIVPSYGAVDSGIQPNTSLSLRDLRVAQPAEEKRALPDTTTSWRRLLGAHKQRRALVAAPQTPDDAISVVQAARAHGFTEVWLRTSLDGTDAAQAMLAAALSAGKRANLPVIALVSLLRAGGAPAVPERTILGEEGTTNPDDRFVRDPYLPFETWLPFDTYQRLAWSDRYAGWVQPTRDDLLQRVSVIAGTPGLAGLAFTGTAPPGFRPSDRVDPFSSGAGEDLGYTEARRLSYLRIAGIDPVDIESQPQYLFADLRLPYFDDGSDADSLPAQWSAYRVAESEALLHDVYAAVRTLRPTIPLFLADRASEAMTTNFRYFGSWSAAKRLPDHKLMFFPSPVAQATAAHVVSRVVLLTERAEPGDDATMRSELKNLLSAAAESMTAPWDGFALDLTPLTPAAARTVIDALPTVP